MTFERRQLVLASRSPRRIELLERIGRRPLVDPADIDESPKDREAPIDYVRRLSHEKASRVLLRHPDAVVLGADTCVELDGVVLGQPADRNEARATLRRLSGRTHNVHTAVTLADAARCETVVDSARVSFMPVSDQMLDWYLDTGESMGKAGAYAVQGHGGVLVTAVRGLMSTVVGLPLGPTAALLQSFGA